uniref:hypothetical protein n=1 Tax=Dongia deserti TaxID=2268030 RepID=UPI00254745DC
LLYALAFWSFIRAARVLQRLAATRTAPAARPRAAAPQAGRPAQARPSRTGKGLPVNRAPTVQRMR